MANYAKIKVKPSSRVRIKQSGALRNKVVARVPRNTRIRIKRT